MVNHVNHVNKQSLLTETCLLIVNQSCFYFAINVYTDAFRENDFIFE
jgi:hypothetical protein